MAVLSHFQCVNSTQPSDYCPPGSLVHELLRRKILEWVVILPPPGGLMMKIESMYAYACLVTMTGLTTKNRKAAVGIRLN